ncbi:hypothetical protein ACH0B6_14020 [Solibacillus silvestris]
MEQKVVCRKCSQSVNRNDYYFQGKVCKLCRSKMANEKLKTLSNTEFAEHLLQKSCENVLARVRGEDKEAYKDVKCDYTKPKQMKIALMENQDFWNEWLKLSNFYRKNGEMLNLRPTIDRIEPDVNNGGHYTMANMQALTYRENISRATKANSTNCIAIFIKGMKVVKITNYESIKKVMKELNIQGYNTVNVFKDKGKLYYIGNGYSIILQTLNGKLKETGTSLYKVVVTKQKILVDNFTGKEQILSTNQTSFNSNGIWFNGNFNAKIR